jgi:hypothetical protein
MACILVLMIIFIALFGYYKDKWVLAAVALSLAINVDFYH